MLHFPRFALSIFDILRVGIVKQCAAAGVLLVVVVELLVGHLRVFGKHLRFVFHQGDVVAGLVRVQLSGRPLLHAGLHLIHSVDQRGVDCIVVAIGRC